MRLHFPKSKIIYGCESRGDGGSPYLTRWTLRETTLGSLYLHHFHRSDADENHDHPWPFVSLILWPVISRKWMVFCTERRQERFSSGPRTGGTVFSFSAKAIRKSSDGPCFGWARKSASGGFGQQ